MNLATAKYVIANPTLFGKAKLVEAKRVVAAHAPRSLNMIMRSVPTIATTTGEKNFLK